MPTSALSELVRTLRINGNDLPKVVEEATLRGVAIDVGSLRDYAWVYTNWQRSHLPDAFLVRFATALAESLSARSVMDPWAELGYFIIPIVEAIVPDRAVAITPNLSDAHAGKTLTQTPQLMWLVGDPFDKLDEVDAFDVIISCPPFGVANYKKVVICNDVTIQDDVGNMVIAEACAKHLAPDGTGLFFVPPSFATRQSSRSLRASLERLGLALSAMIHVPRGFFKSTATDSYLAILDRHRRSDLFVAELSRSDEHNKVVLDNLLGRRAGSELSEGFLTDRSFCGYDQLAASQQAARVARRMGVDEVLMSEICMEINLTKSSDPQAFDDRENALYLPLIGNGEVKTSRADLSMKAHNYAQLVLDPDKALAAYLAGYFNSELGRLTRAALSRGATIPHVSKRSLQASSIHLVPIDVQLKCIEVDSKAWNLASELQALRKGLWEFPRSANKVSLHVKQVNQHDSLTTWMDSLPFPLASILWTFHASGEDSKARYEHLLHFFEAFAQFYAIVMWSATLGSSDLRGDPSYPLRSDRPFKNSFERSTFGGWIEMAGRLSKFGRKLLSGDAHQKDALFNAFGTRSETKLASLFSSQIVDQLQNANSVRNRKSHGGIVGAEDAGKGRVLLESFLASIRSVVGNVWETYPLLKAGAARFKNGLYHYEAESVMGRSTPFQRVEAVTSNPVEDGQLFLYAEDARVGVPLAPLLLVGPSPDTAQNACYFYSRTEGQQFRFVSYHYDQAAEIHRSDIGVGQALKSLIEQTG